VTRSPWRRTLRFLGSAIFATWLLVIVGVWSMLATFVPQGAASNKAVAAWALGHPLIEPVVRAIGLHQAFTSPLFIACVLALGLSTALCAWDRTKVALHKRRTLKHAALTDEVSLADSHDFEIACDPGLSASEVLSIASETLAELGIQPKRRGDVLSSVSAGWSVWGSPVFHWSLLALVLIMLVGNLARADGLMGVAVGQTKPDVAKSYGVLDAGPWHDWGRVKRSIRVDAFEPNYKSGGIDRGPTPTVSVLDESGNVIKTQRVYPNMTLKTGSLTIYPDNYGLAAHVSLVDSSGVETARSIQLIDVSDTATGGTVPAGAIEVNGASGSPLYRVSVTVPFERVNGKFDRTLTADSNARVVVTSLDRTPVLDQTVGMGEDVALPTGGALRVSSTGYYARLSLVDDRSILLIYAGLIVAMCGLTLAVVARQQIVLATVIEGSDGVKLAAKVRLWRNASSTRGEIESELARALGGVEKGSAT
jgi:cytochrome c biogenesis protein ResB